MLTPLSLSRIVADTLLLVITRSREVSADGAAWWPARARDDDVLMRFGRRAREFERTCLECGYSWRVPGAAGRHRMKPISGYSGMPRGELTVRDSVPEVAAPEAISAAAAAYGRCPRCGCDRYTQRTVKA